MWKPNSAHNRNQRTLMQGSNHFRLYMGCTGKKNYISASLFHRKVWNTDQRRATPRRTDSLGTAEAEIGKMSPYIRSYYIYYTVYVCIYIYMCVCPRHTCTYVYIYIYVYSYIVLPTFGSIVSRLHMFQNIADLDLIMHGDVCRYPTFWGTQRYCCGHWLSGRGPIE